MIVNSTRNTQNSRTAEVKVPAENINFRSKFKDKITEEERPAILRAFQEFCSWSQIKARIFLWQLTYNEVSAAKKLEEIGLPNTDKDKILLFRNELRSQYSSLNPDFDYAIPEEYGEEVKNAYVSLLEKSDMIVASQVFYKCQKHVTQELEEDKQKTIFLLKSNLEKFYCGGMKSLGFNWDEVTFLKQFHDEISKLYNTLYDFYKNKFNPLENKPLEGLKDFVEKLRPSPLILDIKEEDSDKSEVKEERVSAKDGVKSITPEVIMSLKDNFEAFLKSLDDISELGLNPLEVIEQKKKIESFLKAMKAFE